VSSLPTLDFHLPTQYRSTWSLVPMSPLNNPVIPSFAFHQRPSKCPSFPYANPSLRRANSMLAYSLESKHISFDHNRVSTCLSVSGRPILELIIVLYLPQHHTITPPSACNPPRKTSPFYHQLTNSDPAQTPFSSHPPSLCTVSFHRYRLLRLLCLGG
jgi:hypothetical protein